MLYIIFNIKLFENYSILKGKEMLRVDVRIKLMLVININLNDIEIKV